MNMIYCIFILYLICIIYGEFINQFFYIYVLGSNMNLIKKICSQSVNGMHSKEK